MPALVVDLLEVVFSAAISLPFCTAIESRATAEQTRATTLIPQQRSFEAAQQRSGP
jgi:hypothetical protein